MSRFSTLIALVIFAVACSVNPSSKTNRTAESEAARSLQAIEVIDSQLNSVIAVAPNVLQQARELDAQPNDERGPLHGWPILLKDNIESRELPTTAGSLALAENQTQRDAPLVKGLRDAGAVIVGKANLSEWANFRSSRSASGWSGVGRQTRNPHDPARSPCGSSSGSGAAVAAGLVRAAVGTETNGSVVCPAAANGIVGIKPTVGLVSRRHIVPISHSQDTAGPMARSVTDATLMLEAMIDADPADPASNAIDPKAWQRSYRAALRADGMRGKRIGVIAGGYHSEVDAIYAQAQRDFEAGGAELIEVEFELPEGFWPAALDVLLYEFKHDLNAYLASLPSAQGSPMTLADLITFNNAHAELEMLWFDQELFEQAEAKGPLSEQDYLDKLALIQQATRADGIDRLFAKHNLDALIAPTGAPAWSIDRINGDHFLGGSSTFAAVSGYPNITVPMGFVHHLPVGLSIFGQRLTETTLIEVAFAYEQATNHWRAPKIWALGEAG